MTTGLSTASAVVSRNDRGQIFFVDRVHIVRSRQWNQRNQSLIWCH